MEKACQAGRRMDQQWGTCEAGSKERAAWDIANLGKALTFKITNREPKLPIKSWLAGRCCTTGYS